MNKYEYRISHKKNNNDNIKIKYLKNLISRILISIILVISICIFIKIDNNNTILVNKYLFEESIKFTKINNWYQNKIGKIIPNIKDNSTMVFSSKDLTKNSYEKYLDGVKINIDKGNPVSLLNGGIVIFIGEKDNYNNTIIIQGNDGIDYWYGNITNISVNLYDYLEKDTLIGESIDNYIYLVLQKDGNYINYEEILK